MPVLNCLTSATFHIQSKIPRNFSLKENVNAFWLWSSAFFWNFPVGWAKKMHLLTIFLQTKPQLQFLTKWKTPPESSALAIRPDHTYMNIQVCTVHVPYNKTTNQEKRPGKLLMIMVFVIQHD